MFRRMHKELAGSSYFLGDGEKDFEGGENSIFLGIPNFAPGVMCSF